jgi:hypothetical protein
MGRCVPPLWRETLAQVRRGRACQGPGTQHSPTIPRMGAVGPRMGAVGPRMGAVGPRMGAVGPSVGAVGPSVGRITPSEGSAGPKKGAVGPSVGRTVPDEGPTRPKMGRTAPSVGRTAPREGPTGPSVGQAGPKMGATGPSVGQTGSGLRNPLVEDRAGLPAPPDLPSPRRSPNRFKEPITLPPLPVRRRTRRGRTPCPGRQVMILHDKLSSCKQPALCQRNSGSFSQHKT